MHIPPLTNWSNWIDMMLALLSCNVANSSTFSVRGRREDEAMGTLMQRQPAVPSAGLTVQILTTLSAPPVAMYIPSGLKARALISLS